MRQRRLFIHDKEIIMLRKCASWLAMGMLSFASGTANAEVLTFVFTGTVTHGGSVAKPGEEVSGHFCYDTDAAPSIKLGKYASYEAPITCKMVVHVGTHKATARNLNIAIVNNFGGDGEDMIDVYGSGVEMDGVSYPNGVVGFRLASSPRKAKVFRSVELRERFNIARFDAMNDGDMNSDGTGNAALLQFKITSIKVSD
jgi:hypothetical protein